MRNYRAQSAYAPSLLFATSVSQFVCYFDSQSVNQSVANMFTYRLAQVLGLSLVFGLDVCERLPVVSFYDCSMIVSTIDLFSGFAHREKADRKSLTEVR